jgi:hypothetical protein
MAAAKLDQAVAYRKKQQAEEALKIAEGNIEKLKEDVKTAEANLDKLL